MTVHFPDLSHYQAGADLQGAAAVIVKATQGVSFTDRAYVAFKAKAAAAGIPFMAYHWVDASPIGAQASHAHAVIGDVPVMWDAEAAGSTVPRLVQITKAYRALGGDVRLVYLPHWWWQQIGSPDLRPLAHAGLALVSSSYPHGGYSEDGPGWAAYGGVAPTIWQWTSSHLFNGIRCDFNAFRGTKAELAALLTGTPTSGADMTPAQEYVQHVINYRLAGLLGGNAVVAVPAFTASNGQKFPAISTPNALAAGLSALTTIARGIAASTGTAGDAAGVDQAELQAAFQAAADALKPTPPPTG